MPIQVTQTDEGDTIPAFGKPALRPEIIALRAELNRELFQVCRLMPDVLRTDAALALLQLSPDPGLRFNLIQKYYPPAYSVLHEVSGPHLPANIWQSAVRAHAYAMFLHLFDDHLVDGQLPLNPLVLQMRTAAWQDMHSALQSLAAHSRSRYAQQTIAAAWNRYFRAVHTQRARPRSRVAEFAGNLDFEHYCRRFLDEMATWLTVPLLLGRLAPGWTGAKRRALVQLYHSFGLAWRLLDDVQDAAEDAQGSVKDSAIYQALNALERPAWFAGELPAVPPSARQLVHARMNAELDRARSIAAREGWSGLHDELSALAAGPGIRRSAGNAKEAGST